MHYDCFIIDDEINISKNTAEYFNMFELQTAYATTYEEALQFLSENEVDIILLDINLSNRSGFELCKAIRQTQDIPIFFISARTSDDDVLTALNIGGDDYVKKPFSLNILLAKVKAMRKRYEAIHTMQNQKSLISREPGMEQVDSRIEIDHNYHQVKVAGDTKKLKEMEYQLLKYLVDHKNQVLTKDELFEKVWNNTYLQEGTLSVHIRHLREKIEEHPNDPIYIKTVWGIGYVFELQE